MDMKSQIKPLLVVGLLSSGITIAAFQLLEWGKGKDFNEVPSAFTSTVSNVGNIPGNPGEFTYAAEKATPAVVHIKTKLPNTLNISTKSRVQTGAVKLRFGL